MTAPDPSPSQEQGRAASGDGNGNRPDNPRPSLVLGTAGHIDHGKTSLVAALTGNDLDRLPEEKARGITIELGFTPLDLGDGTRIALVDVPGHERFVRTMVAGASGLDLLMLVVAADEGVMPQTREHLAICELLGIDRGLVVLTKSDLVDEEMLELATEDVRDALAEGPLAALPILPASATTGDGIEAVRAALRDLVRETRQRPFDGRPARLSIDRTFTKHGFGTVATGTWSGRPLSTGASVLLEPGGRKAKIRGLERHGDAVDHAESGARIAVNLQGVAQDEIHRGDLLTEPGSLLACASFDATVHWLARQANLDAPTSIELLVGTAERRARIAPIGSEPLTPGERGPARIHIEGDPLALLPGDRFVFRGFARDVGVGATLGGGIVLDVAPPRRRRRDPNLVRDLERLAQNDDSEALAVRIERAGLRGTNKKELALETGFHRERIEQVLGKIVLGKQVRVLPSGSCLAEASARRLEETLLETLDRFHAAEPLQSGMPRAALCGSLPANTLVETGPDLLVSLGSSGAVLLRGELVSRPGFETTLDEEQTRLSTRIRERYQGDGLDAPALRTLAEEFGEDLARVRPLAHYLERNGDLVAAPDDLFFDRAAVESLIAKVVTHFDSENDLDTQTLKAMIGTSRRTAMPLMALLDELQITRRAGSIRRLVGREPRW